jgi:hypothetical protein
MLAEVDMSVELKFPDPMEEARKRAAEFQRKTDDERWREIFAMMAFGWAMVKSSPDRDAIERRMTEQEIHWQQIQKDLFSRHGA